jgi:hypothetical protein
MIAGKYDKFSASLVNHDSDDVFLKENNYTQLKKFHSNHDIEIQKPKIVISKLALDHIIP